MITEEQIQREIKRLEYELQTLSQTHEHMVIEHQGRQKQFQQNVTNNQNRFQQLSGAIAQLKQLLNGKEVPNDTTTNGNSKP